MQDPSSVDVVALEKWVEAPIGPVTLRGIIDRLERVDGRLVVSDYKTGKVPRQGYEQSALSGVRFYAVLCEAALGERPDAVQLLYVRTGDTISIQPTDANRRLMENRLTAVHGAIGRACASGDFPARTSALCSFCAYKQWCPEFGGDPRRAAIEAPEAYPGLER
jgi:putative RecB family exonuclease